MTITLHDLLTSTGFWVGTVIGVLLKLVGAWVWHRVVRRPDRPLRSARKSR